jgi:L-alanine-DL-glutamate epimerase-like enolase superfamily enzyme
VKIVDVTTQVFQHPGPRQWASNFGSMTEAGPAIDITLVTVRSEDGLEGYAMGRAVGGAPGAVLATEVSSVARRAVVGEDAWQRERLWQKMWRLGTRTRLSIFAIACIDVALWDLAGKALGMPVYKLIGAYRDKVPAYASSGVLDSVAAYVDEATNCEIRGFKGYKLHPFGVPERDVEAYREVRSAVRDSFALMTDPAGAYDHRQALWVGRHLEELDFYLYEEPLGDYDVSGYVELCRALDIPVMAGEMIAGTLYSAAELIARGATDILRGDVYWKGGLTPVLKMAHLAEAYGMKIELHHAASALMNWANLHAMLAIPNSDFLEILVPEEELNYGLTKYATIDQEGYVHAPEGPGLGAEIDWDFVNAHTVFRGEKG